LEEPGKAELAAADVVVEIGVEDSVLKEEAWQKIRIIVGR
jgi:3-hydroxyacyl-CoA dehydrogenase